MTRLTRLLGALLLLAGAGCVDIAVTKQTLRVYPPVPPDDVQVFASAEAIGQPYDVIAKLHLQDPRVGDTRENVLARLKAQAAALGANAVIAGDLQAPQVPAEFHENPEIHDDLPVPLTGTMDPARQDAWMDVLAVRIKKSN